MKLIGRTGKVAGQDVVLGASVRIGAAPDNDFRVDVTGISRHHARIVRDGDDYWLEDTGSTNGTFVNGLRVARERLRHLDVVTLGRGVDLIAVASAQAGPITPLPTLRAAWLEPIDPQSGSRIDIPPGELTLGRSAPSNVLLDSPLVSHLHARLERTPDHLVVSDLASSNGTYVNGRLIREPVELADGDTVSIAGSRQFRVCIEGGARHEGAPKVDSSRAPVDSEWKTRLVWSADELVELEAERQRILEAWKKQQAAVAAAPAPAPKPDRPAAPKPDHPVAPHPPADKPAAAPPRAERPAPPPRPAQPAAPPAKPAVPRPPPAAPQAKPAAPPPKPAETPVKPATAPFAPAASKPAAEQPAAPRPAAPPPHPAGPGPAKPPAPVAGPAAPESPSTSPIRFVKLTGQSGSFKLGPGRHEVGRSDNIAITLLSPQVSRIHASIIVSTTEVRVEDAKSANGTSINGVKLATGGAGTLTTGDRVAFGNVELTVELVS